jgi:hypothetical protein
MELLGYLGILFAIMSATLMIASELLSPHYGRVSAQIDRRKANQAAYATAGVFIATMAMRILVLLLFP